MTPNVRRAYLFFLLGESFIGCRFINRMNCRDKVPLVAKLEHAVE